MEYTPADISRMRGLMNPTAGDKQQALAQLLTQLGAGLLQGGAPQATPGGGALCFARGAQLGTQAYGQTIDAARKRNLGGLQMQMALDAEALRAAKDGLSKAMKRAKPLPPGHCSANRQWILMCRWAERIWRGVR